MSARLWILLSCVSVVGFVFAALSSFGVVLHVDGLQEMTSKNSICDGDLQKHKNVTWPLGFA